MAFNWKTGRNAALGLPPVLMVNADTPAKMPIGYIAEFIEDTLGPCELMYLPGLTGMRVGDAVIFSLTFTPSVGLLVKGVFQNSARPVAIALNVIPTGSYGWYQISGLGIVNALAAIGPNPVYASTTAGSVTNVADPGDQVLNCNFLSSPGNPAAGQAYAMMNRPSMQGQIT